METRPVDRILKYDSGGELLNPSRINGFSSYGPIEDRLRVIKPTKMTEEAGVLCVLCDQGLWEPFCNS